MPPTATKRPFSQSIPEPAPEPIQGTAIVVIQPGSQWLRIGRASDTFPQTIPHCIARRHKYPGQQQHYEDPWLCRPETQHVEAKAMQKQALKTAEETIRNRPTSLGEYRQCTSSKQNAQYNSVMGADESDVLSPMQWTSTEQKPAYLIGDEALYVRPGDHYNLHWPIRRGRFNIHNNLGGTLSAIMQDLEDLWSMAIEKYLDIPIKDLQHYRAVLLIPDIYDRLHVRELFNLITVRLGFGAAMIQQESVCATFGAGVPSACVVDIGDQKTSVCCVDDGMSQTSTRFCMEYGGSDINRAFYWLMARSQFPYKECNLANRIDALLLQELKETYCHMEQDSVGTKDIHFQVKMPSRNIVKYNMQLGDELLQAPVSVFCPDMYCMVGKQLTRTQQKSTGDCSDPHDEHYLAQTQSKQEQAARLVAAKKRENAEKDNPTQDSMGPNLDDSNLQMDEDSIDPAESLPPAEAPPTASGRGSKKVEEEEMEEEDLGDRMMALDQAILKSIDRCCNDEMKKKMYSCIVVVGGGLMFEGAQSWLQYMIWTQMPGQFRIILETMDVITKPKELDPRLTCWKGGALMCCLDTAQELWIREREWTKLGVKVLRERTPFVW